MNNTSTPQWGQSTNASVTPDGKSIMKPLEQAVHVPLIPLGASTTGFLELGKDIPPLRAFALAVETGCLSWIEDGELRS